MVTRFASIFLCLFGLIMIQANDVFAQRHYGIARLMRPENTTTNAFEKRRGRGTWYTGKDLRNAACFGRDGIARWDAHVNDMVGAMAMNNLEECYNCVRITNNKHKELSVVVMIVDKCAACKVGKAIDLTPTAFELVSPDSDLDSGVLDISWERVACPHDKHLPKRPKGH